MKDKIITLYKKYEEIIAYLIVGVLTTFVSWGVMFLVNWIAFGNPMYPTPFQNICLSVSNWVSGVIFAYFTNRKYVFKSTDPMLSEIPKFVLSRVSTLILDLVIRQVFGLLNINVYVTTVVSAVLVVIANYVFSKLFVFKGTKK